MILALGARASESKREEARGKRRRQHVSTSECMRGKRALSSFIVHLTDLLLNKLLGDSVSCSEKDL